MSTTDQLSSGGRSHAAAARIARAVHRGDKQEEADARRDLAVIKIESAVLAALASCPPLHPEQRNRLSSLLHGARK